MSTQPVKGIVKHVKPLLSIDKLEAKRKVLKLYRDWYKEIPAIILHYNLPVTEEKAKKTLKNAFLKHKNVTDIRVIDMLYIKGRLELQEINLRYKQKCHVMYLFKDTELPPPKDFLSKFINGTD